MAVAHHDLLIIGGGINGAGIARDAAGRGLSVLLVEAGDLGGATSSASSKLIHGGLRYLEHFQFRLVREALAEREVLLRIAGHLVRPLRFVVPHVPRRRPGWKLRLGLLLYDHLARRSTLPASRPVRLDAPPYAGNLRQEVRRGFAYADCAVDDARLVVANALDAAGLGARIRVRTALVSARPVAGIWHASLSNREEVSARVIVNSAGPWAKQVLTERLARRGEALRLVKGSHIVLPRLYPGTHAFLLQNDDGRVVFMIPFESAFTLVGTTDVPFAGDPASVSASEEEIDYLCGAVSRYLPRAVGASEVRCSFAGVRALHDDGAPDPAAITRDYALRLDSSAGAPVITVLGGKITTYRKLAEQVLDRLARYFPTAKGPWTASKGLPGSDFPGPDEALAELTSRYPRVERCVLASILARHGGLARDVLGDGALGEHYGGGLTEREVRYLMEREWATTAEDVLWRRSKAGLHLSKEKQERVAAAMAR